MKLLKTIILVLSSISLFSCTQNNNDQITNITALTENISESSEGLTGPWTGYPHILDFEFFMFDSESEPRNEIERYEEGFICNISTTYYLEVIIKQTTGSITPRFYPETLFVTYKSTYFKLEYKCSEQYESEFGLACFKLKYEIELVNNLGNYFFDGKVLGVDFENRIIDNNKIEYRYLETLNLKVRL